MVKKYFCDIRDCNNEAWNLNILTCRGYKTSTTNRSGTIRYEPFEKPSIEKMDLCEEHYKKWCEATYNALFKNKRGEVV